MSSSEDDGGWTTVERKKPKKLRPEEVKSLSKNLEQEFCDVQSPRKNGQSSSSPIKKENTKVVQYSALSSKGKRRRSDESQKGTTKKMDKKISPKASLAQFVQSLNQSNTQNKQKRKTKTTTAKKFPAQENNMMKWLADKDNKQIFIDSPVPKRIIPAAEGKFTDDNNQSGLISPNQIESNNTLTDEKILDSPSGNKDDLMTTKIDDFASSPKKVDVSFLPFEIRLNLAKARLSKSPESPKKGTPEPKFKKSTRGSVSVNVTGVFGTNDLKDYSLDEQMSILREAKKKEDKKNKLDKSGEYRTVYTQFKNEGTTFAAAPVPSAVKERSIRMDKIERIPADRYDNELINNQFGDTVTKLISEMDEEELNVIITKTPVKGESPHYSCNLCTFNLKKHKARVVAHVKNKHGHKEAEVLISHRISTDVIYNCFHYDGTDYACKFDGCTFNAITLPTCVKHFREKHGSIFDHPFRCFDCGECFGLQAHLNEHQRTHKKPHKCSFVGCTKGFINKSLLAAHEMIHIGKDPYNCGICGMGFTTYPGLKYHKDTHTSQQYNCPVCTKKIKGAYCLELHLRKHLSSNFQVIKCPLEGCLVEVVKISLDDHIAVHERFSNSSCSLCLIPFNNEEEYKSHMESLSHWEKLEQALIQCEGIHLDKLPEGEFYNQIQFVETDPKDGSTPCFCENPEHCERSGSLYHPRTRCDCDPSKQCTNREFIFDVKEIKYKNFSYKIGDFIKCSSSCMNYFWRLTRIDPDQSKNKEYGYSGVANGRDGFQGRTTTHLQGNDGGLARSLFYKTGATVKKQVFGLASSPEGIYDPWCSYLKEIMFIKILDLTDPTKGANVSIGGPIGMMKKYVEGYITDVDADLNRRFAD